MKVAYQVSAFLVGIIVVCIALYLILFVGTWYGLIAPVVAGLGLLYYFNES
jgi:hypothetical protein